MNELSGYSNWDLVQYIKIAKNKQTRRKIELKMLKYLMTTEENELIWWKQREHGLFMFQGGGNITPKNLWTKV